MQVVAAVAVAAQAAERRAARLTAVGTAHTRGRRGGPQVEDRRAALVATHAGEVEPVAPRVHVAEDAPQVDDLLLVKLAPVDEDVGAAARGVRLERPAQLELRQDLAERRPAFHAPEPRRGVVPVPAGRNLWLGRLRDPQARLHPRNLFRGHDLPVDHDVLGKGLVGREPGEAKQPDQ